MRGQGKNGLISPKRVREAIARGAKQSLIRGLLRRPDRIGFPRNDLKLILLEFLSWTLYIFTGGNKEI